MSTESGAEQVRESEYHLACPRCGSTEMAVSAVQHITAYINGKTLDLEDDRTYDTEWDNDSDCRCTDCQYEAKVKDFDVEQDGEWKVMLTIFSYSNGGSMTEEIGRFPRYDDAREHADETNVYHASIKLELDRFDA